MIKTLLFVPSADNSGEPFPSDMWNALEEQLVQFGGYNFQADIEGAWVDDGRLYRDRNRSYSIALTSIRQLPPWVAIVEWALEHFRQEALYVELNGSPEIVRKHTA
jgi:hypothetical protein